MPFMNLEFPKRVLNGMLTERKNLTALSQAEAVFITHVSSGEKGRAVISLVKGKSRRR